MIKRWLKDCRPTWLKFGPNSDGQEWIRGIVFRCPSCERPHAIEFRPVIGPKIIRADSEKAMDETPCFPGQPIWKRVSGETFETLWIDPQIDSGHECYCTIQAGELICSGGRL
jgi:hypothetical protein